MRTVFLFLLSSLCAAVALAQSAVPAALPFAVHNCSSPVDPNLSANAAAARDRAAAFFAELGFVLNRRDIVRQVEFFCTADSARRALAAAFGSPESEIPATFSGTVQNATLFLVSPQLYKKNFIQLYGSALWRDDEYEKLMLHELLHSAHELVAKQLFGSEDGMGPPWLFEGLAIVASGQLPVHQSELNQLTVNDFNEFLRAAQNGELKSPVYVQYSKFYRFLLRFVSNQWLVQNAGKPDLPDLLRQAISHSSC
jgi:hypothetical protein